MYMFPSQRTPHAHTKMGDAAAPVRGARKLPLEWGVVLDFAQMLCGDLFDGLAYEGKPLTSPRSSLWQHSDGKQSP